MTRADWTRREMLQRASGLMAGAAFLPNLVPNSQAPASGGGSPAASSAAMTALSAYMADARSRPLPDPVIEKAKHHVLDTCAAMISGADLPPGRAAIDFARAYGGSTDRDRGGVRPATADRSRRRWSTA